MLLLLHRRNAPVGRGLVFLLGISFIILGESETAAVPCTFDQWSGKLCLSDMRMNPTHEEYRGQSFLWQIPRNPKAVVFLAHGGLKTPFTFFDTGQHCRSCYGQPEERILVLNALDRNYAVIALKSVGTGWQNWPMDTSVDLATATDLVIEWTRNYSLTGLPLFALGHSSGGAFASVLPYRLPIQAAVVICSGGSARAIEMATPGHYPPIFFVYMNVTREESDHHIPTKEVTLRAIDTLRAKGLRAVARQCSKKQVSPAYLRSHIRCLTVDMADNVHAALAAEGWLDEDDYLARNPASGTWIDAMWKWRTLPQCAGGSALFLQSDLDEELAVAFGHHSFTSEWNDEIFQWLDSIVALKEDVVTSFSSCL